MRAIFISYRRDDAEGQAGRLFADLTHHFGDDAVFMDVAAIEPGRDFRRAIDQQVASCGVLLALIGKRWVTAQNESGARRLDDPTDFVRLETASALKRDIPVIPVLVQGATMPRVEDLPEDLKELAFRNGVELTHARWESDLQVLVKALRPYVQVKREPLGSPPRFVPSESGSRGVLPSRKIIAGLIGVLILACGWYVWQPGAPEEPAPQPAPVGNAQVSPTPDKSPRTPKPETPAGSSPPGSSTPEANTAHEQPAKPAPKYASLIGSWSGSDDCPLIFSKDDGKEVEGRCDPDTGVRHKFTGLYAAKNIIKITITRIDREGCETHVEGEIKIESSNTIVVSSGGWNGCGVKTDVPPPTRLQRS